MTRLAPTLALLLALGAPALAGPFDDLSDTDRAAFEQLVRDYLLQNPEIIMEAVAILEDREAAADELAANAALEQYRQEIFADGYSWVGGNPEGDVTIVEFIDYQCSFCKRAHPEVAELVSSDGNIRLIQKEFPILGPMSQIAARAAQAVLLNDGAEVYASFSDALMRHEGELNEAVIAGLAREAGADVEAMEERSASDEVTEYLTRNLVIGQALKISGTPTFLIEDTFIRGYRPLEGMRETVAQVREAAALPTAR